MSIRRDHHPMKNAAPWRSLFEEHRGALSLVAEIVADTCASSSSILLCTEARIQGITVLDGFHYPFAIRSAVQVALEHSPVHGAPDGIDLLQYENSELAYFRDRMEALPLQERRTLFLRDVLEYSRRETALLLKSSDAHIDELLIYARKRLVLAGPVSVEQVRGHYRTDTTPTIGQTRKHPLAAVN